MEPDEEKLKKINDELVEFMCKRSETPRYAARLKAYVNVHHKRQRAAVARRNSEHGKKKVDNDQKTGEKTAENTHDLLSREHRRPQQIVNEEDRMSRSKGAVGTCGRTHRARSLSRSSSGEPSEKCCRPRRRRRRRSCRRRRRRRRRSGRRRRRRRSCRRRSSYRRRRRRRSRRRRRRSCRRRRRSRRRRPRRTCCKRGCGS